MMRDFLADLFAFLVANVILAIVIGTLTVLGCLGCDAKGAPVPRPRPKRNLAAERARFPSPEVVRRRTQWLRDKDWQFADWHSPEEIKYRDPVYYAWYIWDDIRLHDEAGSDHWRRSYLDRVRRWLGEEDYRRGKLPPARWWEIPLPAERNGILGR